MSTMSACRACKSDHLFMFLPLGSHPPANAFLRADQLDQPEFSCPLDTHVCLACGLIQVPNRIPPDFFRNYLYVPSASETMHGHFEEFARRICGPIVEDPDGLVVDIGSNDGLFLGFVTRLGWRALGIEPATNLAALARARGVETVNEYFGSDTARDVRARHGAARVITTTNTFNHIDDLHGFMSGVAALLDDRGTFIIEVPHAVDLVEKNEFDTVYHEHVSEFSVKSIVDLLARFDMVVTDVERLPIHGGSMRVSGRRRTSGVSSTVAAEWIRGEADAGLFEKATYIAFKERVETIRSELMALLHDLKRAGKRLAGYGAPAKGNTLLNYYGIGPDLLEFLADRNPLKHGLYSPGMHIPVVPADRVLETRPDYLLILAWNFADEIMAQQAEYARGGGRFILPIPRPLVV
ncbi:MAG TPA: class I SAM-dependent methyltransferase [Vicinamibacterales bacterium]|nr:class I SAM-dependent methyltransferase [Vicinamibacterales bacterium]